MLIKGFFIRRCLERLAGNALQKRFSHIEKNTRQEVFKRIGTICREDKYLVVMKGMNGGCYPSKHSFGLIITDYTRHYLV